MARRGKERLKSWEGPVPGFLRARLSFWFATYPIWAFEGPLGWEDTRKLQLGEEKKQEVKI